MEKIKTSLSITIDDEIVEYGRVPQFIIADSDYSTESLVYYVRTNNKEKHKELVTKLVEQLKCQSHDHGSEWRVTKRDIVNENDYVQFSLVAFRIRDSY